MVNPVRRGFHGNITIKIFPTGTDSASFYTTFKKNKIKKSTTQNLSVVAVSVKSAIATSRNYKQSGLAS